MFSFYVLRNKFLAILKVLPSVTRNLVLVPEDSRGRHRDGRPRTLRSGQPSVLYKELNSIYFQLSYVCLRTHEGYIGRQNVVVLIHSPTPCTQ